MEFIALIIILGGIAAAVYGLMSKNDNKKPIQSGPKFGQIGGSDPLAGEDAQFWTLKPGDLVKQISGVDFLVRRTIKLNESGYAWHEHLLDDAQGQRKWLSVEDDDGIDLGLWEPVLPGEFESGEPGDKSVALRSRTFTLDENGTAFYNTVSPEGEPSSGQVEYFQYVAADKSMLAFQRYDNGKWEASFGETVSPSDFEIFPSTEQSEGK